MAVESEVRIKEIIQRTHNVKSFRLEVKGRKDFKAGQYLIVTLKTEKKLSKPLSISSSPTELDYIEFTKKITDSEFSQTLNKLKSADSVKLKYPFGEFAFEGEYKKIAFLSGGIGITPIRSICKYVVDKNLDTDIVLLYGNRTSQDIAFRDDFDAMHKQYPKLKVIHILSEAKDEWQGKRGLINAGLVKEEIPDYAERKFYICGPPAMVEAMQKILLEELNLPKENIFTENFIGY